MGDGIGLLIGMASGQAEARAEEHAEDLQRMREELGRKLGDVVYQAAFKEAAAAVHEEIIDELRLSADGRLSERRLSDPKNVDARNEVYAERAAEAVSRLSQGRIKMSRVSIDRVKRTRPLK